MSEKFSQNQAQSRWTRLTQNIYFLQERDKSAQPVRKLAQSCLTHKMVLLLFILFMFAGHSKLTSSDSQKQFCLLHSVMRIKGQEEASPITETLILAAFLMVQFHTFSNSGSPAVDSRPLDRVPTQTFCGCDEASEVTRCENPPSFKPGTSSLLQHTSLHLYFIFKWFISLLIRKIAPGSLTVHQLTDLFTYLLKLLFYWDRTQQKTFINVSKIFLFLH